MAMTIRLTPDQQERFAARARREGVSVSSMMIRDCETATTQAEKRRRLLEVSADVLEKSAELYRRLA